MQAGKLKRKPSGGDRAGLLKEESEPRIKGIFLAETRRKITGLTFQLAVLFLYHGFGNASCLKEEGRSGDEKKSTKTGGSVKIFYNMLFPADILLPCHEAVVK